MENLEKDKILGQGAFSKVLKVLNHNDNQVYALKKINLKKISKLDLQNLYQEIQLHQNLVHDNIIKFYQSLKE